MTKLTKQQWKEYYPMINEMIRGTIKSQLIIVTENLKDIPDGILNHCILIDNTKEMEV